MGSMSELHIQMQDSLFNTIKLVEEGELGYLDGLIALRKEKVQFEQSLEIIKDFENNKLSEIDNEAKKYPDGYLGKSISVTAGRKTWDFKGIKEIQDLDKAKKAAEQKYCAAFDGFQKGIVQTTRLNEDDPESPLGFIDENGEVLPFPEVNYGKSFVTIKDLKPKK